jgi:hypothetical protein
VIKVALFSRGLQRDASVAPRHGERGVFRDQAICVFAPAPVDPQTAPFSIHVSSGESPPEVLEGEVEVCGEGRLIFWRARSPLERDVTHTVRVAGLRDVRGSLLPELLAVFTTGPLLLSDLLLD